MQDRRSNESATSKAIAASVMESMQSGTWRNYSGPKSDQLVRWLQTRTNCEHVRLCSSGTIAVELALKALHLREGDEVILSGYDFPGNFRAVEDAGGTVVLCDPVPDAGWVLTPERLEQSYAPKCRAIVISHLHGQMAPMAEVLDWASSRGVVVIEDACQAHGAVIDGKPTGAWGHLSAFSYGGSKLISAGRGGAVLTNDPLWAQRMRVFCERGNDAFAMSEIQAAIILPQCENLERDHQTRLEAAFSLARLLQNRSTIRCPAIPETSSPAFYKFGLLTSNAHGTDYRDRLVKHLLDQGIETGPGFLGFGNRSAKRFRTSHSLDVSRSLAANTLLIHHSQLLDPRTGASRVQEVANAMEHAEKELST